VTAAQALAMLKSTGTLRGVDASRHELLATAVNQPCAVAISNLSCLGSANTKEPAWMPPSEVLHLLP
jgi:hypothetical protein